ncbi:MAG: hypothetical protein GX081_06645 [Firmicutes bacterium]|nr:hypothetical protein [Bacillota bacterium]
MKKKGGERPEEGKNRFWQGLCLGVFCALFLATALVSAFLSAGGFRITLDPSQPALLVRDQIKAEALTILGLCLEKMKVELPVAIRQAFQDPGWRFITAEEGAVSLPLEVSEAAKEQLLNLAEQTVLNFLKAIDLTPYIEDLGQTALHEVKAAFHREVIGKTYHYQINPYLAVPVTVTGRE